MIGLEAGELAVKELGATTVRLWEQANSGTFNIGTEIVWRVLDAHSHIVQTAGSRISSIGRLVGLGYHNAGQVDSV